MFMWLCLAKRVTLSSHDRQFNWSQAALTLQKRGSEPWGWSDKCTNIYHMVEASLSLYWLATHQADGSAYPLMSGPACLCECAREEGGLRLSTSVNKQRHHWAWKPDCSSPQRGPQPHPLPEAVVWACVFVWQKQAILTTLEFQQRPFFVFRKTFSLKKMHILMVRYDQYLN